MTININDKETQLKISIRAYMMYENITDGTFQLKSTNDVITFFYCIYCASAKDYSLSFDDFIDYLDENPNKIAEFGNFIMNDMKTQDALKKK